MPKRGNGKLGDLLSSDEVIARLLDDERLRRLALTCVLPAVRCGSEWKYRRSDLDAWIERQRGDAAPANDIH